MEKTIDFVCCVERTTHNGQVYLRGQYWDGDLPAPRHGVEWAVCQNPELPSPSRGFVQWAPQPGRLRPPELTDREKAILEADPYGDISESATVPVASEPAAPPVAPAPEPPPLPTELFMETDEEREYPFGRDHARSTTWEGEKT